MQDSAFTGTHYKAWTIRNAPRDPIPNSKANYQKQEAAIWNLITPYGFSYSLVSASLQGAIRQGKVLEAMQWCLEMIGTDVDLNSRSVGKGETNFWTRAYIIAAEDISLANPIMLIIAANHITGKITYNTFEEAERGALYMTMWLARSMKTRIADWACICRVPIREEYNMASYYDNLCKMLAKSNQIMAIGYAEAFIERSLAEKEAGVKESLSKVTFEEFAKVVTVKGQKIKHYNNLRQLIWVAIFRVLNYLNNYDKKYPIVTQITEACYDLAHADRFRWESSARLFDRVAILTICLRDQIEARGLEFKFNPLDRDFTSDEIEQIRLHHKNNGLWFGISDICKDKHSKIGKQLGRDIQHFIEHKAFLRHEDPAFASLSDFYLDLCFKTRYISNSFDKSDLTSLQYAEWIPTLRLRNNNLNLIEDTIQKETITITFCEVMENHVGMQKIGTLAPQGFTVEELTLIENSFKASGIETLHYDLRQGQNDRDPASILILRGLGEKLATYTENPSAIAGIDYVLLELLKLDWDKKAKMKGKVVNKHARHNLCFGDFNQEPNYEEGKGRVIDFNSLPGLKSIRDKLSQCFGPKANNLLAEGNRYYDLAKCFIGAHGDFERRIVIGLRFGASMDIQFQWYLNSTPTGEKMKFILHHGDVYIMSHKAVGSDWKRPSILTLRHSANVK